jgi:hypothetical protein
MAWLGCDSDGKAVSGVWDTEANVPSDFTAREISNGAQIGWTHNGSAWVDPRTYTEKRKYEYPGFGDQLDDLYKQGLFSTDMAATIQAVKDKYPKS